MSTARLANARRRLRFVPAVVTIAVAGALGACAPRAPGIADPVRVDAHCSPRQARITSIRSILTSTDDRLLPDRPSLAEIRASVFSGDGAIAYWNDQLLRLPRVARQLHESGDYVHVRAVAIPPAPQGAETRHIYLLVRDHGRNRWITMQAFDHQDICIEGHRQS